MFWLFADKKRIVNLIKGLLCSICISPFYSQLFVELKNTLCNLKRIHPIKEHHVACFGVEGECHAPQVSGKSYHRSLSTQNKLQSSMCVIHVCKWNGLHQSIKLYLYSLSINDNIRKVFMTIRFRRVSNTQVMITQFLCSTTRKSLENL